MKQSLAAILCVFAGLTATSAQSDTDLSSLPQTASTHAYAELRKAQRKDGELFIEVRFLTDYSGYSGEVIYEDLANSEIYIEADGQQFSLSNDDSKSAAPQKLELKFNYDPDKNPRVGSWKATFEAPPAEITEATLKLPNVGEIGPFEITDR